MKPCRVMVIKHSNVFAGKAEENNPLGPLLLDVVCF